MTAGWVEPVDLAELADRVGERAVALADPGTGRCARVGVDGAVPSDTTLVAAAVVAAVAGRGRPVAAVDAVDFLHQRSIRLEYGADDPDAGYDRWVDHGALRREVLDPLGPRGSRRWLVSLRDPVSDRATREPPRTAVGGTVAVVSGPFLLRPQTLGGLDLTVHLSTSPAAIARRLGGADRGRVLGAWARYLSDVDPARHADVVVALERPTRPAVLHRGG